MGAYLAVICVPQTKWNNAVIHSCIKIKPTHLAAINSVLEVKNISTMCSNVDKEH